MGSFEKTNMHFYETSKYYGDVENSCSRDLEVGKRESVEKLDNYSKDYPNEIGNVENGQEIAERMHVQTKEHALEKYGYTMSETQKQRLENENSKELVSVISSNEYSERYNPDISVKGHCDSEGNIVMRDGDESFIKHVTVHETMHYSSFRENALSGSSECIRSGLRETRFEDGVAVEDNNRAINEGFTEMYTNEELAEIVKRSSRILNIPLDNEGALLIASRSRGTPRIANRLLKRSRDFAEVKYDGVINKNAAEEALSSMDIDELGLDAIDRRLLSTMIKNYNGGPVGLETISAAIGEESVTIEDVYEPYLMQIGFLSRTPRGRCVTPAGYKHLGIEFNSDNTQQKLDL